jgi:ketosteroid isomerase-like protein
MAKRHWNSGSSVLRAAALTLLLGACATPGPDAELRERNEQVVRAFFAALNDADVAQLDKLYAPDFEIWTAGSLPISGSRTRAQSLEGMGMIAAMFPEGLQFTITALTIEGDRVAIEAESDGQHVSGKRYHNQYHFLVLLRDGKIVRLKEYMDTSHAADVLMAPPAGS